MQLAKIWPHCMLGMISKRANGKPASTFATLFRKITLCTKAMRPFWPAPPSERGAAQRRIQEQRRVLPAKQPSLIIQGQRHQQQRRQDQSIGIESSKHQPVITAVQEAIGLQASKRVGDGHFLGNRRIRGNDLLYNSRRAAARMG